MGNNVLHLPPLEDRALERALRELHDRVNQLEGAVNAPPASGKQSDTQGKPGDVRLTRGADNNFYIQGRFKEGWATSRQNVFQEAKNSDVPQQFIASNVYVPGKEAIPVNVDIAVVGLQAGQVAVTSGGVAVALDPDVTSYVILNRCVDASENTVACWFTAIAATGFTATSVANATLHWVIVPI